MQPFRTVLVDDEPMALRSIERLCTPNDHIQLIGSFGNGEEALEFLSSNETDLLFLDVEMPGISGIELLEQLTHHPQVVITTSKAEYAFEAFEYNVTDFLKKPITLPRFQSCLEKIKTRASFLTSLAAKSNEKEIYIRNDGKMVRIPIESILYFENIGDYVKIITTDKNHVIQIALKTLNDRLNHPRLLKVHRSYIVNMDKIVDIADNSIVIGQKVIPISRAHKSLVLNAINIIN